MKIRVTQKAITNTLSTFIILTSFCFLLLIFFGMIRISIAVHFLSAAFICGYIATCFAAINQKSYFYSVLAGIAGTAASILIASQYFLAEKFYMSVWGVITTAVILSVLIIAVFKKTEIVKKLKTLN